MPSRDRDPSRRYPAPGIPVARTSGARSGYPAPGIPVARTSGARSGYPAPGIPVARTSGARSGYRGRFAPSPTGPLHFGSLVAAVGSYLSARRAGGDWLVRIEDLDPPREVAGSADAIIAALAAFGFEWNESIVRQSSRAEAYRAAVEQLAGAGLAYPCSCSRTELQAAQPPGRGEDEELFYPGWCRHGLRAPERTTALRFQVPAGQMQFDDQLQGRIAIDLSKASGDFVIRRRDGLHAYQLAVVVDDAAQSITHVVRGADLLSSTPRQIALQAALGLQAPMYAHLPVVTDFNGVKLSKSTGAAAIDTARPSRELWRALEFLKQTPPMALTRGSVQNLWEWAIEHWHVQSLHGMRQARIDDPP